MILVCISSMANAQSWFNNLEENTKDFFRYKFLKKEYTEIGIQVGGAGYIGDMNNHVFSADNKSVLGFNSYSAGISAKHYLNPISARDRTWGIRLDLNYNRLRGKDAWSSDASKISRNLQFTNNVWEGSLMGEFHFFDFRPNRMRSVLSPYVFAGMGMIYHNPKAPHPDGSGKVSLIDQMVELREISRDPETDTVTRAVVHSKVAMLIPFGAGVKYNLSGSLAPWSIGLELNYRYVFNDFLDGVGNKEYIDYSLFAKNNAPSLDQADWEKLSYPSNSGNPYATVIGTARGDKGNDSYMTAVLRVTYTFYKWRDPLWRNPNARRR